MRIKFKFLLATLLLTVVGHTLKAQNLLDLQGWLPGTGSAGIFVGNGSTNENVREWGEGPNGKRVVVWKASPEGDAFADGGWNSTSFNINAQMMYRFSVWIKKTNSTNGITYFGCQSVMGLDNIVNSNPYFWHGSLPALDKWYLLIGYIHASNDPSTINYGGIYDGDSGMKIQGITDFKFLANATQTYHRSYLYYDPNVNDRQYFYAPRVDLVNGDEPSIPALLGLQSISSAQGYFSGKVGIKTTNPGDYDLAVNGNIRAKEIKVETANWPDYVFETDYQNTSLTELEKYIKAHQHLPDMPSAKEAEANGISLGEMNKVMLKKVEELTLHLIEKDKALNKSAIKVELLESEINAVLKRLLKVEEKINK